MRICWISAGASGVPGVQPILQALSAMGQEQPAATVVERFQQLKVEEAVFAPLPVKGIEMLQRASDCGALVQAGQMESDPQLFVLVQKLKETGINVRFAERSPTLHPLQAREAQVEGYSALVVLGESMEASDTVAVLCCNVDDSTGEELGWAMEQLMAAGARDVFFTPIQMKKNRPSTMVTVVCTPGQEEQFCRLLMQHTSTIGVRWNYFERAVMRRSFQTVQSPWGELQLKCCRYGEVEKVSVEYESAKRAALRCGCSVGEILRWREAQNHIADSFRK